MPDTGRDPDTRSPHFIETLRHLIRMIRGLYPTKTKTKTNIKTHTETEAEAESPKL